MPTYEYRCKKCGENFEIFQSFSAKELRRHPECGGPVEKVIHPRGIVFKGSGFYVTDSRPKSTSSSESGGANGSSSDKGSSGDSDSKSDAKSSDAKSSESKSGDSKPGEKSASSERSKRDGHKSGEKSKSNPKRSPATSRD